jgi:ABC-type antimicrobial peptide transport system permease subunit
VPVTNVTTQTADINKMINQEIVMARLGTTFAILALLIACIGLYGTMAYGVARRTREIGIRVALGSSRPRVVLTILRRPLIQMATGIAFGGALTCLWIIEFGLTVSSVFGAAGYLLAMVLVCLLACVVPARRALKIDPIAALRVD